MKLICTFCIIAVCFCYGCEKKKNTAPSSVTTTTHPIDTTKVASIYPYTDTFYGVFNDNADDAGNDVFPDTSFATTFYVVHKDSASIEIKASVTQYKAGCFIHNSIWDGPTCFFVGYSIDESFYTDTTQYTFTGTYTGFYFPVALYDMYLFTGDSLYVKDEFGSSSVDNYGTFAGKGHVH
jgi:hypothetical protein